MKKDFAHRSRYAPGRVEEWIKSGKGNWTRLDSHGLLFAVADYLRVLNPFPKESK